MAVTSCGSSSVIGPAYTWLRNPQYDVRGVRAPLQVRIDGGLCDMPGGGKNPFNYAWIAIQCDIGFCQDISQIGIRHDFGSGGAHWCRSYGIGTGQLADYNCGQDADDANVWFQIVRYFNGTNYRYSIMDCGKSGGYGSNCVSKNDEDIAYTHPLGAVLSEVNYGAQNNGANCIIHIMGSTGDKQNVGTSNYPLEGSTDDGSNWSTRSWNFGWDHNDSSCATNYGHNNGSAGNITFWDTRNSS